MSQCPDSDIVFDKNASQDRKVASEWVDRKEEAEEWGAL